MCITSNIDCGWKSFVLLLFGLAIYESLLCWNWVTTHEKRKENSTSAVNQWPFLLFHFMRWTYTSCPHFLAQFFVALAIKGFSLLFFKIAFFYANYLELREHKNTQINSKNLAYYYDLVSFQLFPVILQNMTKHFLLLLLLLSNIIQ